MDFSSFDRRSRSQSQSTGGVRSSGATGSALPQPVAAAQATAGAAETAQNPSLETALIEDFFWWMGMQQTWECSVPRHTTCSNYACTMKCTSYALGIGRASTSLCTNYKYKEPLNYKEILYLVLLFILTIIDDCCMLLCKLMELNWNTWHLSCTRYVLCTASILDNL